ncbi:MAG: choice-of-anchor D domain-containing protein [Hamadaea sp.]|nr:choice-of-anchor D domain-containing protein [Hamadaea sp.]
MTGAVALALSAVVVTPTPAYAAAPTSPYTALYIDGSPHSWWHQGAKVFDQVNGSTFTASAGAGEVIDFRADNGTDNWTFKITPPTGATWTAGTTYDIAGYAQAGAAQIDVTHSGATCDEAPGKLTVKDVVRDAGTSAVTAFAASFVISCFSNYQDLNGEIRWNSSVGYAAAGSDLMSHYFGEQVVGSAPLTKTFTLTSLGSESTVFGTAKFNDLGGPTQDAFSITGDTCSGQTVAYGETCTVTVTSAPVKPGSAGSFLELPDNTTFGKRWIQVVTTGVDPRKVTISPTQLYYDTQYIGEPGGSKTVTITGTGPTPMKFGTASITGTGASSFAITSDTCAGKSIASGQTCSVTVKAQPTTLGSKSATLQLPNDSFTTPLTVPMSLTGQSGAAGLYFPVPPARIMDTRSGLGVPKAQLGNNATATLQVLGRGGVPSFGVGAVVLNVTVTAPSASSWLTVYPSGVDKPLASSLNFQKGWVRSNSVTVAVGADGKVKINNAQGWVHVIVDVTGYYAKDSSIWSAGGVTGNHGQFHPLPPERLYDTRLDRPNGERLPADWRTRIGLDYGDVINSKMKAVILNITAVSPMGNGWLTAWEGQWPQPNTSTVNYTTGSIIPNFAIVPIQHCYDCPWESKYPTFGVYTSTTSHILVDIVGYIDDGTIANGLRFIPKTPTRIVDSREGRGLPAALGPNTTKTITTPGNVLSSGVQALALNVTTVAPTSGTYLKVWPAGTTAPPISTLNAAAGQSVANAAITWLNPSSQFNVYNNAGTTGLVADVVGTYWLYPATATGAAVGGQGIAGPVSPTLNKVYTSVNG